MGTDAFLKMIVWSAASDSGKVRPRNEDAYDVFGLTAPVTGQVFVVADGMGGSRAGDVASRLAVETLRNHLLAWSQQCSADVENLASEALVAAFHDAHRQLLIKAAADPDLQGMGTTMTAVRVTPRGFQYAHVGDSRLYLLRRGALVQVSRDHALVADLVRAGEITEQQAMLHPHRHILTQALGQPGDIEVDRGSRELQPGDALLLCTDGLTEVLRDDELRAALQHEPIEKLAEHLVQLANRRGGQDNITVVAVYRQAVERRSGRVAGGGTEL